MDHTLKLTKKNPNNHTWKHTLTRIHMPKNLSIPPSPPPSHRHPVSINVTFDHYGEYGGECCCCRLERGGDRVWWDSGRGRSVHISGVTSTEIWVDLTYLILSCDRWGRSQLHCFLHKINDKTYTTRRYMRCRGHHMIFPQKALSERLEAPFKIKVFDALQTRWSFGPSKCNSNLKMKTLSSLEVRDIICPPQEPTSVGHCHYKKWS